MVPILTQPANQKMRLSQMDVAISLHHICIRSHKCILKLCKTCSLKFHCLPNQCFHIIEFMHHEALPLAGRLAHMHTASGAEQWSYTHREVHTIIHRSSSPVI